MLPNTTLLGHLKIFEIYEFYTMPVLFACQNKANQIYMAVWIDENEEKDIWLYVSLSPQRFAQIRNGYIDLHDAFAKAEDDMVLGVIIYKDPLRPSEVNSIPVQEMDSSWPPLPGDYLDVPNSLPRVVWQNVDQRDEQNHTPSEVVVPQPWYQQLGLWWLATEQQVP